MQDLVPWPWAPCIQIEESYPLNHQGSSLTGYFRKGPQGLGPFHIRELSEQGALGGVLKFSNKNYQSNFSQSSAELANGLAFEDPRLTFKIRPTMHLHVMRLKNRDRKITCFPGHTNRPKSPLSSKHRSQHQRIWGSVQLQWKISAQTSRVCCNGFQLSAWKKLSPSKDNGRDHAGDF